MARGTYLPPEMELRLFFVVIYGTDLHREAIGPIGSNCFTRGVRIRFSKEGALCPPPPSGSTHTMEASVANRMINLSTFQKYDLVEADCIQALTLSYFRLLSSADKF